MENIKFQYFENNGSVIIVGCEGIPRTLSIPSMINGYPVTCIRGYAFARSLDLTSITIPDTVQMIGTGAFLGCLSLSQIKLGNGVEIIEDSAFMDCSALRSIKIPISAKSICKSAFSGCTSLSKLELDSGLEIVGIDPFEKCKIFIPEDVDFDEDVISLETQQETSGNFSSSEAIDELYIAARDIVIELQQASVSLIQGRFQINSARAAKIICQLEANGVVSPYEKNNPRTVLKSE